MTPNEIFFPLQFNTHTLFWTGNINFWSMFLCLVLGETELICYGFNTLWSFVLSFTCVISIRKYSSLLNWSHSYMDSFSSISKPMKQSQ